MTETGKGLVRVQKKPTAAGSPNLLVKPKGKAPKALAESVVGRLCKQPRTAV